MTVLLPGGALGSVPAGLQAELLAAYSEVVTNYRARRWEPSELSGGKLCEIVYSILKGWADSSYPLKASKPKNMLDACKILENSSLPRSARIQIPRMLIALYEVRNNRSVGHVGGDVDPNRMDAECVVALSRWVLAELVRLHHTIPTEEATALVDAIVDRQVPTVWVIGGNQRVLAEGLSSRDQVLLLLYGSHTGALAAELASWIEYANLSRLRKTVLGALHKERMIEYNSGSDRAILSPKGIADVETRLGAHLS